MKIYVTQIYIEVGATFPFGHLFQQRIHRELTQATVPSQLFLDKYGDNYTLIFRMSAKFSIAENEIRGPTNYKKSKQVEYSIFLPYDRIASEKEPNKSALLHLFQGIRSVLEKLEIDTAEIERRETNWIAEFCSEPTMFQDSEP